MRWHVDMYGGRPFDDAAEYLKSPCRDALLQERQRSRSPDTQGGHAGED